MADKGRNIFEVRAFPAQVDRYSQFIDEGFIAIGWEAMNDVTDLSEDDIKQRVNSIYPHYIQRTATQIANFFIRLKNMKKGDIILIPYITDEDGPILTIAKVVESYTYKDEFKQDDIAHQVKIKPFATISRDELADKYKAFNQTLNARLVITKINVNRHRKAIGFIENILNDSKVHENPKKDLQSEYVKSIKIIEESCNSVKDNDLSKKALIFSALSINESYLVSLIRREIIPIMQDNQVLYDVLKGTLLNRLNYKDTREKVANAFFDNFKLKSDYYDLRNLLAHSMGSVTINGTTISFYSKNKGKIVPININDLFNDLLRYGDIISIKGEEEDRNSDL
ncbi:hypothetical protein [Leuconostoc pseudomesenteroides]|uniref:hypothetical protein n=1 Tax=Leuconostoc pseudomesenteroides TaxID=33968 RepID=UPI0032DE8E95